VGLKGATFKIAQLSDLHVSGVGATEEATLKHLKALQPDLILLTGDVIGDRHAMPELDAFLEGFPDAIKVAILGNWEHWSGADLQQLSAIYKRHQVRLLVNECMPLMVTYEFGGAGRLHSRPARSGTHTAAMHPGRTHHHGAALTRHV
jgi:predicted MPP superfamily phosphohydrolase